MDRLTRLIAKTALAAVAAAGLALPAPAHADLNTVPDGTEWRENIYNPAPAQGDVFLPLPCGGAMTFRRIATPNTDGSLGDVAVTLGQDGSDLPYLDGMWRSYVSGAFADAESARGYFYLAKYELNAAQYDVTTAFFAGEPCPDRINRRRGASPKINLSRLDAERFAQDLTLWLMRERPDALPMAGETRSFLRLPTEEEWEFAARGGLAVEAALFRAPLPAIGDGESQNEYIAHGGSDSAGGELQLIGTLKPNPLGLHDMLGNAAEIVGTAFSLVRHGRLHGQAGGVVKRGGDARTPLGQINAATRFEMAPFDVREAQPMTERFTGTRLVLSALAITSKEQNAQLIEDLDRLAAPDRGSEAGQTEEEVLAMLGRMRSAAITDAERARLTAIEDILDAARAERNAQRDRAVRMILNSSVLLCNQAVGSYLNALFVSLTIQNDLDELEAEARAMNDAAFLDEVLRAKAEARTRMGNLADRLEKDVTDYANLIEGLADEYSRDLLVQQAEFIRDRHTERGLRRESCYRLFMTHLNARVVAGFSDIPLMRSDFEALAEAVANQQ